MIFEGITFLFSACLILAVPIFISMRSRLNRKKEELDFGIRQSEIQIEINRNKIIRDHNVNLIDETAVLVANLIEMKTEREKL